MSDLEQIESSGIRAKEIITSTELPQMTAEQYEEYKTLRQQTRITSDEGTNRGLIFKQAKGETAVIVIDTTNRRFGIALPVEEQPE